MRVWTILLSVATIGCNSTTKIEEDTSTIQGLSDADGDGFFSDEDCDDTDIQVNPGVEEICDGIDNNCDGETDEGVLGEFYADSDDDGYGNPNITTQACSEQDGFVANGSDCDDANSNSYPGAIELCDAMDNDCDDEIDEELDIEFYVDTDEDGFGDSEQIVSGCAPDQNLSTVGGDCNDLDPSISPIANEICDEEDNNCDGTIDEDVANTYYADSDQDGYGDILNTTEACSLPFGYIDNNSDCDDIDSNVNPAAEEVCDVQDNDCDGSIDEEGAIGGSIWYEDGDNDEYGDPTDTKIACIQPTGYVTDNTDCDDDNAIFNPIADELCNGYDDNCNGNIDEEGAIDATDWYADDDNDGYGDSASILASCSQPTGYISDSTDCDDNDDDTYPGAVELCNGDDDDCDGESDEQAEGMTTWYLDDDGDGYGETQNTEQGCSVPTGYAVMGGDCNDSDILIFPGTDELCDSQDNNCDGNIDENTAIDTSTWYLDYDGDSYGTDGISLVACDAPNSFVDNIDDCDDTDANIYPAATEICDGKDNDCNAVVDDSDILNYTTFYEDSDGDGYGGSNTVEDCAMPTGYSTLTGDCQEADSSIHPDALEICDTVDNNCDGNIDDSTSLDVGIWYFDDDGDEYGDATITESACTVPNDYVSTAGDCNDSDAAINPLATDVCDGVDNDCDGSVDNDGALNGSSEECPISDCSELDSTFGDGLYWIDPDGTGSFEVYCELSSNDGPWTWLYYNNLKAYWDFDGSDQTLDRISGYSGNNTGSSSSNLPVAGFGSSVYFDNSEGTRISLNSGPQLGTEGSVSYWSYCQSCSNNQIPLMFDDMCSYIGDHYWYTQWYDCTHGSIALEQTQTCGDAVWKHNLYVYDSSGIRVYIDGQEVVNNNSTFTSSLSLAYIGNRPSFGTNGLDGNIDDLFFSSDILDDTDATRIYQQGLQGHPMRWQ